VEIFAEVGNQLGVGWMVHRLDTDDPRLERVLVLLHVPVEVQLRLRRTDDEDLAFARERAGDRLKIPVLVVGMIPDADVLFVRVTMDVPARRLNDGLVHLARLDLEDAGFFVSDPNDGVVHDILHS